MDIEGAEEILLDSRIALPNSLKHIIIETHPWNYSQAETDKLIISKICSSGFEVIHKIETSILFSKKI